MYTKYAYCRADRPVTSIVWTSTNLVRLFFAVPACRYRTKRHLAKSTNSWVSFHHRAYAIEISDSHWTKTREVSFLHVANIVYLIYILKIFWVCCVPYVFRFKSYRRWLKGLILMHITDIAVLRKLNEYAFIRQVNKQLLQRILYVFLKNYTGSTKLLTEKTWNTHLVWSFSQCDERI